MPPRILRAAIDLSNIPRTSARSKKPAICLFCAHSKPRLANPPSKQRRSYEHRSRLVSNLATSIQNEPSVSPVPTDPRTELQASLRELQKHARRFVNLSRLQLALHGLQQTPGNEAIRIAILGLADGGKSLRSAREVLRLLLADPLKEEEEWERILLEAKQAGKPLLLRVGHTETENGNSGGWLVRELRVSSPALNGHNLEILVLEMDPPVGGADEAFAESVLVPSMEIPTSNTGRYTPVTTPVHKSLIVGEGILGATSLTSYPTSLNRDLIGFTANISLADKDSSLPFQIVDISQGTNALNSFRQSIDNALSYEQQWFASGIQDLVEWVKVGTAQTEAEMKKPLQELITSLLRRTTAAIESEEASKLAASLSSDVSTDQLESLRKGLSVWAENAHTELRDQLDVAFDSNRWRKLSWWKLFWRVDDVSMIASDILSRKFLTNADHEVIFLAGRIAQAHVVEKASCDDPNWAYKPVTNSKTVYIIGGQPPPPTLYNLLEPRDRVINSQVSKRWPGHISLTRTYLSLDTIPALQALAQKLVLQTFTTSSFASIAAGLIYVSTISTTLYEAGAVAALGIVWSMRRMQGKWETARSFWEGEVREEGRKAVRGVEGAVGEVLKERTKSVVEFDEELEQAKAAITRAEEALRRCT